MNALSDPGSLVFRHHQWHVNQMLAEEPHLKLVCALIFSRVVLFEWFLPMSESSFDVRSSCSLPQNIFDFRIQVPGDLQGIRIPIER